MVKRRPGLEPGSPDNMSGALPTELPAPLAKCLTNFDVKGLNVNELLVWDFN